MSGQELEQAQADLGRVWQVRVADLLEEDPDAEAELRALVEEITAMLPAGAVCAASYSVAAGGDVNVRADRGSVAAGVIHGNVAALGPTGPGPGSGEPGPGSPGT